MNRSDLELYLDIDQQNSVFSSTEELLGQIQRILIYWLAQTSGGENVMEETEKLFGYWESRCVETAKQGPKLPYITMREALSLNRFEEFLVWIACIRQLDGEFAAELSGEGSSEELTLEDAFYLFRRLTVEDMEAEYRLLDPNDRLNVVLFQDWEEEQTERRLQRPVKLKKTALDFLLEQDCGIHELTGITVCLEPDEEPLLQNEELYGQCRDYLERIRNGKSKGVIQLSGAEGAGKSFLLKKLGESTEFVAVFLGFLLERKNVRRDLREIISYCVLRRKYVALQQLPEKLEPDMLGYFLEVLTEYIPVVCVMTETPLRIRYPGKSCPMEAELPGATREQQMHFWEYFAEKYQCKALCSHGAELANLYRLMPGEIERMVRKLRARFGEGTEVSYDEAKDVIVSELMEDAGRKLQGLAVPLVTGFSMEDLQLPGQQMRILKFAISAIRNRYLVMEGMGFGKKMPYGRGISILLYGPPGTGKTMTAQVIAKEVGLTLFRVDSSRIMDKYIGETEKKLGELFETAKNTNAILFFDEADSLFAKRTEVSKSTDKYANNEVSFLLQLMEQYEGIMVLATNHSNFFDEAFRRRITYSINLPSPDAETRSRLWRLAFPEGVEIAEDVDFDQLAREHEFTGSSIKYVAQQAMFTAAILQSPVTLECIHTGLKLMMERDCQGYKDGSLQACFTRLL